MTENICCEQILLQPKTVLTHTTISIPDRSYPKSVVSACVSEINDQFKWFVVERFQRQKNMVDQKVTINIKNPKQDKFIATIQFTTVNEQKHQRDEKHSIHSNTGYAF